MHFTQILGLSLFAVGQVSCAALPGNSTAINVPRGELVDRAAAEPVSCGSGGDVKAYGSEAVKKAYNNGKNYWKAYDSSRCSDSGNCYPKSYGGNGGNVRASLPAECNANSKDGTLVEWPLMGDGSIYQGGKPGPDRIVMFDSNNDGKTVNFCGVMSHRGTGGTNFYWCPRATS